MQSKEEVYRNQLLPLLEQIVEICEESDIAMLTSFCLEHNEAMDGNREMLLTGATHLDKVTDPPLPFLYAAAMLKVPGFVLDEIGLLNPPKLAAAVPNGYQ